MKHPRHATSSSGTSRSAESLSSLKAKAFFLVTLSFPVLFLALVEVTLRLVNYGPDLSLFTNVVVNGKTYRMMNPEVSARYFSRVDFRPSTSTDCFLEPKPPGTFRIFCLGASTTVGYPYGYNASFPTFLRERLQRTFPDRHVETINLGMTATNSFTVCDFAADLADEQPDLIIDYGGHNEFYGALGVASRESVGQSRWITRLYLRCVHLKTFQLLRDLYGGITAVFSKEQVGVGRGTMMERLARGKTVLFDSPEYRNALEIFRLNLAGLAGTARGMHVPLIVGGQVSNLRDLPPFVSLPSPGLTDTQLNEFDKTFDSAEEEQQRGQWLQAIAGFRRAGILDSGRADVFYEIGRCLDTLGRWSGADSAYVRARDLDQLRFRASSDFNAALASVADGATVFFADMERAFRSRSPHGLIGHTLILEHLHPNARGAFLLAREYAGVMAAHGILAPRAEWERRDTVSDEELWNARPMTDIDELIAQRKTEILTSGWPFKPGYPVVPAVDKSDTLRMFVENVTRGIWSPTHAHRAALEYYESRHQLDKAEGEFRALLSEQPLDVDARLRYAHLLLQQGRLDEMRTQLLATLPLRKTILAYRALGDLALRSGRPGDAIDYYHAMAPFSQTPEERIENGYLLGLAYIAAGHRDSAAAQLRSLLARKPDFEPAIRALQRLGADR